MPVEIRLKKILERYGLDKKGIVQRMADELEVHRHSIGKLYRNQARQPSLKLLGRVCTWLAEQGVPPHVLPQQLFGIEALKFWEALAASGKVTFYLGEYQQETGAPTHGQRWISRRDAEAANEIIKRLSTPEIVHGHPPQVTTNYIPFRPVPKGNGGENRKLQEDIAWAGRAFERMRSVTPRGSAVLVGSQRVNYLLEHLVAELFGLKAFQPIEQAIRLPIYLRYRDTDVAAPSCFGGAGGRPGIPAFTQPGTYYLSKAGKWEGFPWQRREKDSGVVITVRDPGNETLETAVFGFSGRATVAIGRRLFEEAGSFWPPKVRAKGKQVGVYVCQLTFKSAAPDDPNDMPEADRFSVTPVAGSILEGCLAK